MKTRCHFYFTFYLPASRTFIYLAMASTIQHVQHLQHVGYHVDYYHVGYYHVGYHVGHHVGYHVGYLQRCRWGYDLHPVRWSSGLLVGQREYCSKSKTKRPHRCGCGWRQIPGASLLIFQKELCRRVPMSCIPGIGMP